MVGDIVHHNLNVEIYVIQQSINHLTFQRVSHFVNMAFDNIELETSNLAFADVVRKVINDPIKEDIHPFGRGHLYASAFDGVQPQIRHAEGKYLMWVLASLFIIGIAGSVILMSCE